MATPQNRFSIHDREIGGICNSNITYTRWVYEELINGKWVRFIDHSRPDQLICAICKTFLRRQNPNEPYFCMCKIKKMEIKQFL